MAVLFEQFVENLTASRLVSDADISTAIGSLAAEQRNDARALADTLIRSGRLTRYQARSVYHGRVRSLVVDEYLLLERIGRGGMGEVFKARHRTLDRIVALKLLDRQLAKNPDFVKRFHREMRAVAKLSHPSIVQAYDADQSRGRLYLAMEFVDGTDLGALLKAQGPVELPRALDYVVQAARGLEYAHQQGVVHRDVKPANLMLDCDGTLKILDFGLAAFEQRGGASSHLTQTGDVMGSVDFMSPEQLNNTREADQRSDVYSLGCVLYLLLTAKPVFSGVSVMTKLAGHMHGEIPSLRAQLPGAPEAVDRVFQRMIAKAPEDRYQSMSDVIRDLAPFVANCDPTPDTESTGPVAARVGGLPTTPDDSTKYAFDFSADTPRETVVSRPPQRRRETPAKPQRSRVRQFAAIGILLGVLALITGVVAVQEFRDRADQRSRNLAGAGDGADSPPTEQSGSPESDKAVQAAIPAESSIPVFVLAGQSNMGGPAPLSDLAALAQDPAWSETIGQLQTPEGTWLEREDVWIRNIADFMNSSGRLKAGFGERVGRFGPELGFGQVVGNAFDKPVLIIKVAQGPMSLGMEGKPPGSGGEGGLYYHRLVTQVDETLENVPELFPELASWPCEIVGFVWFQGWNDTRDATWSAEYHDNLCHLIRDLREAWNAPQMRVVIGELGQAGPIDSETERVGHVLTLQVRSAQMGVPELPEFRGTAKFVPTTNYIDAPIPHKGFLYGEDAEFFYRIGEDFGTAMLELLGKSPREGLADSTPLTISRRPPTPAD